jgi:integrase/recombinase XerD
MVKYELPPPSCTGRCELESLLEEFLLALEAAGASPSTLKSYRSAIKDFLGFVGKRYSDELNPQDFLAWRVKRMKEGLRFSRGDREASTRTLYYYTLFVRSFLTWLGVFKGRPPSVAKPRQVKLRTVLSRDEVRRLFNASRDILDVLILSLLMETGLRAKEVLSIRKSDVDLEKREIRVLKAKYGESRVVFMGPLTYSVLSKYLPLLRDDDRLIPLTYSGLYKRLKSLATRAGIDPRKVRPHVFRHTFATESLRRGLALPALQAILGHRDIKTTQVYLHLAVEDIKELYMKTFYGSGQTAEVG